MYHRWGGSPEACQIEISQVNTPPCTHLAFRLIRFSGLSLAQKRVQEFFERTSADVIFAGPLIAKTMLACLMTTCQSRFSSDGQFDPFVQRISLAFPTLA